jgi:hypothetical protein
MIGSTSALLLAVRASAQRRGSFHCCISQRAARARTALLEADRCVECEKGLGSGFVRKGVIALLVLVFALHAGFSCGTAPATTATIQSPCCGDSCPMHSVAGDGACCQTHDSGTTDQVISGKSHLPSIPALAGILRPCLALPALSGIVRTFAFHAGPAVASKLALLCSRQI